MSDSIEKLVSDLVDSLLLEDFSVQKQFYLTQSLLALTRAAHTSGYKQGCRDTARKFESINTSATKFTAEEFTAYVHQAKEKKH